MMVLQTLQESYPLPFKLLQPNRPSPTQDLGSKPSPSLQTFSEPVPADRRQSRSGEGNTTQQLFHDRLTVDGGDFPHFILARRLAQLKSERLCVGMEVLVQSSNDDLHVFCVFADARDGLVKKGGVVVDVLQGDLQRSCPCCRRATYGKSNRYL